MSKSDKRNGTESKRARERLHQARIERRENRRRKKKRERSQEQLRESDCCLSTLHVNCLSKRAYESKLEAVRLKPRGLYIYQCSVCDLWHFSSSPSRERESSDA